MSNSKFNKDSVNADNMGKFKCMYTHFYINRYGTNYG